MSWNIVNESYPRILRGILQQTLEGLPYVAPTRTIASRNEAGVTTSEEIREVGLRLRRFKLNYRGATGANVGIGFRWANRYWIAGQYVAATTTFTDDTADAQDGPVATPDFALMTTTAGDGFIVASTRKFSWVSLRIETASAGASLDTTAEYTNFAGTGWTAVDANSRFEPAGSSLVVSAGTNFGDAEERAFVWAPPDNWGQTTQGLVTDLPAGLYALRFTFDVATTAGVASVMEVGSLLAVEGVTVSPTAEYEDENTTFFDPYGEALMAFFSVADAGNRVYAEVTTG